MHSPCHLSFGMHKSCRIPVSSPLTALEFMKFIIRSFYPQKTKEFEKFAIEKTFVEQGYFETLYSNEGSIFRILTN